MNIEEIDISKCPFRDGGHSPRVGNVDIITRKGRKIFYYVYCPDCGAEGPKESSSRKAIEAWNNVWERI